VASCAAALRRAGIEPEAIDLVVSLDNGDPYLAMLEADALARVFGGHRPAACAIVHRFGDGAFGGILRALVASLTLAGRVRPAWPAPALAEAGFHLPAHQPAAALVAGLAGGGSAVALVLTRTG
jgi:3-oxoacyl-(acyl-carrier-protein) synthase